MTRRRTAILAGLAWLAGTWSVAAQQPVTKATSMTATATIQAIDQTRRTITLRNDKNEEDTYSVGPAVARFNELKVGQTVRMTYYESMVFQLLKPGQTANPASYEAALNRAKSTLPAGSVATQEKMTVTVNAVDMTVPSITVTTANGRTIIRKVEDRKNLEGVKAGDRIEITYTQAVLTAVEASK